MKIDILKIFKEIKKELSLKELVEVIVRSAVDQAVKSTFKEMRNGDNSTETT